MKAREATTMNTTTTDSLTRDEAIGRIKASLKARSGKAWSVRGGRGTAWGWITIDVRVAYGRLYQTPFADRIRHEAGVPVVTVGGVSSWDDVSSVIAARRADLVALAREHLYDPHFTRHAAAAQGVPQEWPEQYQWALGRYDPPRR